MSNELKDFDVNQRIENAKVVTVEKVKSLRIHLDSVANKVEKLDFDNPSVLMYLMNCHNSIMMAKAHLGNLLGGLDQDTPYVMDGKRHSVADIEQATDKAPFDYMLVAMDWERLNGIEQIDAIREILKHLKKTLWRINTDYITLSGQDLSNSSRRCVVYTEQHIIEARFNLGFVLGELRKENM
jgi:hypothetical protein